MFFAESKGLATWKLVEGARMGEDRYTGAPMRSWEFSPHVVLGYDAANKRIHPTPALAFAGEEKRLANLTQWDGICYTSVSWETKIQPMFNVHEANADFLNILRKGMTGA